MRWMAGEGGGLSDARRYGRIKGVGGHMLRFAQLHAMTFAVVGFMRDLLRCQLQFFRASLDCGSLHGREGISRRLEDR